MTIKECYDIIGEYDDVFGRFRREELVKKFLLKFLDDKSYDMLCESMANADCEEAFRAVHTIKGICQNLGFTMLYEPAYKLTESLRDGKITAESIQLLNEVKAAYTKTSEAILAIDP